jgi:hypothetical protein
MRKLIAIFQEMKMAMYIGKPPNMALKWDGRYRSRYLALR